MKSSIATAVALLAVATALCACPDEQTGPGLPTPLKPPERIAVTEEPDKVSGSKAERYTKLLAMHANHTEATLNEFVFILQRGASDCVGTETKVRKLVDQAVKRWSQITRELGPLSKSMNEVDYAQVKLSSSKLIAETMTRAMDGIAASKPMLMQFKRNCPNQLESIRTQIGRLLEAMQAIQRLKR